MNDLENQKFLQKYADFYGREATSAAQAPGRLEILGNHTDYNEGFVLSCAVTQNTKVALAPNNSRICKVKDFRDGAEMKFSLDEMDAPPSRDGSRYIKGMIKELISRGVDNIGGFDCALESTIPLSAGMSSSAALEVAAGYAIGKEFGIDLEKVEWARAGQGVENNYMGLKTGLLDQFSSIFGKKDSMIVSDFRTDEVVKVVALPPGYSIVVINSMVKHNLVDSEYNSRRADCENAASVMQKLYPGVKTLRDVSLDQLDKARPHLDRSAYLRALHVVGECTRVKLAVAALAKNDVAEFGRLLFDSHDSSRMNFANSSPELDYLVELAHSVPGCIGARLSGGGFGGITIHLVKEVDAKEYSRRISEGFKLRSGILPQTIICNIGDGASLIK